MLATRVGRRALLQRRRGADTPTAGGRGAPLVADARARPQRARSHV